MKAIVYRESGSLESLQLEDVEKPSPAEGEVLVSVRAAAVNILDWYLFRSVLSRLLPGRRKPKRIGRDIAGVVEAVGRNVTRFKPGDEVFGVARGAFAEYVCASEAMLAIKPPRITFEQAAGIGVAGLTALQGLRRVGGIQPGDNVLINGASGGVGTFAVQFAKALGCEVTGVCSTRNMELVRSIGADHVIDYEREDFTKRPERYDLILDIVSKSWRARAGVLTKTGRYVFAGGKPLHALGLMAISPFFGRKLKMYITKPGHEDLELIRELIQSGAVTPVVDRVYALEEAARAIKHVAGGHNRGKVVISIAGSQISQQSR
jgi:NADPH:quinone reductase-like Zn-dependent oxidoreductase